MSTGFKLIQEIFFHASWTNFGWQNILKGTVLPVLTSMERIVGHIAHELEHYVGMFIEFGKKKIEVRIPPTAKPTNAGELGMQIGEETFY